MPLLQPVRWPRPLLCCLLVAALSASVAVPIAWGGSGQVLHLPLNNRTKLKAKLRLNVDLRWADGTGYRPITLEAIPTPGPAATDRQIRVTLRPNVSSEREVSTLVDIPQGSRSAKKVVLAPQDELWQTVSIEVEEDGTQIEELSVRYASFNRSNPSVWTEAAPTILFIDSDTPHRAQREAQIAGFRAAGTDPSPTHLLPDYRNLVRTFPGSNFSGSMISLRRGRTTSDSELLSQLNDESRAEMLPLAELPEEWIALTSFDMVCISAGDLGDLLTKHPKRFEALREWLHAGGTLCVYDVGTRYERLAELESRLKLPKRPKSESQKAEYRGWIEPDVRKRYADLPQTVYEARGYSETMPDATLGGSTLYELGTDAKQKDADSPPETWPFLVRDAGFGYVVAIAEENPFPGIRSQWTWMLNTVPNEHWMWFRRHGQSQHRTNNDFWNFLIPGVGVAPVLSFALLITLFAAVIGPVNYILLGRMRRLYLLLITVPAGAAIVTAGLFLYALATDGIGVRSRIRSFTELDARTGHAVSWSRQSYYASIAPSQGLTFPPDAIVHPLIHEPTSNGGHRAHGQRLEWDEDQHFQGGYLRSRSATQFLVVRAGPTQSRLIVQPQAEGKPPQVKNQLGTDVSYLLIADRKSAAVSSQNGSPQTTLATYWQVESLAAGGVATAKAVSSREVEERLQRVYRDNSPAYPAGYDPTLHNSAMAFMTNSYSRYTHVDSGQASPRTATSKLERQLERLAWGGEVILEPGAFLALTDSPAEVPLGVAGMRQDRSLHVVHGRW